MWATMGKLRGVQRARRRPRRGARGQDRRARGRGRQDDADAVRADALFPVRQRRQDIMTQMAVSVQGYMALDLVRRNNLELIRGVDRAQTTTVAALRTAVIVSQALSPAEARPRPDHRAEHRDVEPHRVDVRSSCGMQGAQINQQAASADRRRREAAGGVRQRVRDDGRPRHVPRPGRAEHGADGERAGGPDPARAAVPRAHAAGRGHRRDHRVTPRG